MIERADNINDSTTKTYYFQYTRSNNYTKFQQSRNSRPEQQYLYYNMSLYPCAETFFFVSSLIINNCHAYSERDRERFYVIFIRRSMSIILLFLFSFTCHMYNTSVCISHSGDGGVERLTFPLAFARCLISWHVCSLRFENIDVLSFFSCRALILIFGVLESRLICLEIRGQYCFHGHLYFTVSLKTLKMFDVVYGS